MRSNSYISAIFKLRLKPAITFAVFLLTVSSIDSQTEQPSYSFFAAGHTYGNPISFQYGLHPPFVDYIPTINSYPDLELGFLTGDVVPTATAAYWDSAEVDINSLDMPVYMAAGNHDIGKEFSSRYQYFNSMVHKGDLFITLAPGLTEWNIIGEQLEFLTTTLESNYKSVKNIFIFVHELIWWSPSNKYNVININFLPHYPGSTNFNTVVKPLLLSYPNPITIFAGDLGATEKVSSFMYDRIANITLIGSGMGGGVRDNIIITDVFKDSVRYNLVAINGSDPDKLGELSDNILSAALEAPVVKNIQIFPNPCREFCTIWNNEMLDFEMSLIDLNGNLVMRDSLSAQTSAYIATSELSRGIYFVQLVGANVQLAYKLIVN